MTNLFRSGRFVALLAVLMLTVAASGDGVGATTTQSDFDRQMEEQDQARRDAETRRIIDEQQEQLLAEQDAREAAAAAEEAAGCADASGESAARPAALNAVQDGSDQVWIVAQFCLAMDELRRFFSAFLLLSVTYNPTVEIGWETHDGTEIVLGTTSQAYVLDDGSLLLATGLFPTGNYQLEIDAEFGSWEDEAGQPIFGEASYVIDSEAVGGGEPFEYFDAEPVFDLVAGG